MRRVSGLIVLAALAVPSCATEHTVVDGPDPADDRTASAAANAPLHDLYVGAPAAGGSGVVELRLRGNAAGPILLAPPDPQPGARFGTSILSTRLDTTYQTTFVLVGAPGLDVGGEADAGGIHVYERTSDGPRHLDLLTQDHPGIPGEAQEGAEFGSAFAVTAGEDHEPAVVYVGLPGLDVAGADQAGGVLELDLTAYVGGTEIGGTLHTLGDLASPRQPQPGDRLGAAITPNLWGAPGATVNGQRGAGLVVDDEYRIIHQGTAGFQGSPEAGDAFGSSLATAWGDQSRTTWIGVPGEDVGETEDAGMVNSVYAQDGVLRPGDAYTQNTSDDGSGGPVQGLAEEGDRFGSSMCLYRNEGPRLLVGTPGEHIRGIIDAGSVTGLLGAESVSQDTVGGQVLAGEGFGATVYCKGRRTLEGQDILIGVPGADREAGIVVHGVHRVGHSSVTWDRWSPSGVQAAGAYGSGTVSNLPF